MKPYYQDDSVTIYHGDCREVLADVLPAEPAVWLTDPPYSSGGFQEAGKAAGSIGTTRELTDDDRLALDTLSTRGYQRLMREVLRNARHCDEIGVFTDWRMWVHTADAIEDAGFMMRAMVVWAKPGGGIGRPWLNAHELLAFGMKRAANKDRIGQPNVITCPRSGNKLHPTEKPLHLIQTILGNMADGVVVDPFMGSGTTLMAAKNLGRRAIGVDVRESYCEAAALRCSQETLALGAA